jgi:anti-anti-sigma factor
MKHPNRPAVPFEDTSADAPPSLSLKRNPTLSIRRRGLRASLTRLSNVAVLRLEGQLVLGPEREAMNTLLADLSSNQPTGLLFDLAGLTRLDSVGLGEIVVIAAVMKKQQIPIAFARPSYRLKELLRLTRVCTLGPIFDDLDKGLKSFTQPSLSPPSH